MMTARAIHALVVLTVLPFLMLRGAVLRRYLAIDLASYVLAAIVWPHVDGVDPYAAAVGFIALKIATFSLFVATAREIRWSANRAAGAAVLVYSLLVPAMQRTPIDGDEPFYLLVTESIVRDFDLDLANQYRELETSGIGRRDLQPQPGDPVGSRGERYSRHEPLLSVLMIPGYLAGGLSGALITIVVFASLLVRSTVRLFEEEGIDDATTRIVFPFLAFGPPIVFYAARIWPEVPAAFLFVEGVRGVRNRRAQRWVPALLFLALLKLRFILVVLPLVARAVARSRRHAVAAMAIIAVPLVVLWIMTGSATNVHSLRELIAPGYGGPFHGFFGLLLDGAAGIAFQAPFYLLGVFAFVRWKEMPEGFRLGMLSVLPYVILLIPRSEWHGGWSPPLRYIVFLMPVLALGAGALLMPSPARGRGWREAPGEGLLGRGDFPSSAASRHLLPASGEKALTGLGIAALWTLGLVVYGVAHPWRLFHIANGENAVGEALSRLYASDFSRLFPSFIRLNYAAIVASVLLVLALIVFAFLRRFSLPAPVGVSILVALLAAGFVAGRKPVSRVEFEDAHVIHRGGELFPHEYTVARFAHRGGWILHEGHALSFRATPGPAMLHYVTGIPSLIQIGTKVYPLDAGEGYRAIRVDVPADERVILRCVRGSVNLDRLVRN